MAGFEERFELQDPCACPGNMCEQLERDQDPHTTSEEYLYAHLSLSVIGVSPLAAFTWGKKTLTLSVPCPSCYKKRSVFACSHIFSCSLHVAYCCARM